MSSPFESGLPDEPPPSPPVATATPPAATATPPADPSQLSSRRSWRDWLRIAVAIAWLLALLAYYGQGIISLGILVYQQGFSAFNGPAIAHAFLFDQLLSLPEGQPIASVLLLLGILVFTIAGDWALLTTLQKWAAARRSHKSTQPLLPPDITDQPIATMGAAQFLVVIRDIMHQELQIFEESQGRQFRVNLVLAIAAVVLGIISIIPTVALISGATNTPH